jgi:hypothetical protein
MTIELQLLSSINEQLGLDAISMNIAKSYLTQEQTAEIEKTHAKNQELQEKLKQKIDELKNNK